VEGEVPLTEGGGIIKRGNQEETIDQGNDTSSTQRGGKV